MEVLSGRSRLLHPRPTRRAGKLRPPLGGIARPVRWTPGARLYACKASVDMFKLDKDDFIPQVDDVLTVGEFYALAAGGQIIFT